MTSAEDLLQELESLAMHGSGAKVSRVLTILDRLEWRIREGRGSHKVARSPRGRNIVIAGKSGIVKRYCLQQLFEEAQRCGGV